MSEIRLNPKDNLLVLKRFHNILYSIGGKEEWAKELKNILKKQGVVLKRLLCVIDDSLKYELRIDPRGINFEDSNIQDKFLHTFAQDLWFSEINHYQDLRFSEINHYHEAAIYNNREQNYWGYDNKSGGKIEYSSRGGGADNPAVLEALRVFIDPIQFRFGRYEIVDNMFKFLKESSLPCGSNYRYIFSKDTGRKAEADLLNISWVSGISENIRLHVEDYKTFSNIDIAVEGVIKPVWDEAQEFVKALDFVDSELLGIRITLDTSCREVSSILCLEPKKFNKFDSTVDPAFLGVKMNFKTFENVIEN